MGNAKIVFDLDVDEDGFPPISSEALYATKAGDQELVIDNTPFFVEGVALGDRVAVTPMPGNPAKYRFVKVLESSLNKAISVVFFDPEVKQTVIDYLRSQACYCEYGEFYKAGELEMLAVNVPLTADYDAIFAYLSSLEETEQLSFAELAV